MSNSPETPPYRDAELFREAPPLSDAELLGEHPPIGPLGEDLDSWTGEDPPPRTLKQRVLRFISGMAGDYDEEKS